MKRKIIISASLTLVLLVGLVVLLAALAGKRTGNSKPQMLSSAHVIWASATPTPANTLIANANTVVKVSNTNANANLVNANVVLNSNANTNYFDPVTGVWDAVTNWVSPKSKKTFRPIAKKVPAKVKKAPATHKKVVKPFKPKRVTAQLPKQPTNAPPTSAAQNALAIKAVSEKSTYFQGERIAVMAIISGGTPPYKVNGNPLTLDEKGRGIWFPKTLPDLGSHTLRVQVVDGKNDKATFPVHVTIVEPTGSPPPLARTDVQPPKVKIEEASEASEGGYETGRLTKVLAMIVLLCYLGLLSQPYRKLSSRGQTEKKQFLLGLMIVPALLVGLFVALV